MKYQNKNKTIVEAVQWFKEGDHPEVVKVLITPEGIVMEDSIIFAAWEYAIGDLVTLTYGIAADEKLALVSPGDYIITDASGNCYPCEPDVFERDYQPACA